MNLRRFSTVIALAGVGMAFVSSEGAAQANAPITREVPLPGTNEVVVCAVYPPQVASGEKAGLIVHLYGSNGSHTNFNIGRPPFDTLRRLVAERGYWLVVPELGPRHWMNDAAVARVDAVIADWIQREGVDPERVHLLGSSMGAGSSLVYVMRRPGLAKSVAAIFPPTDWPRFGEEKPVYRKAISEAHHLDEADCYAGLRALSPLYHPEAFRQTPVFLLHGAKDDTVPVEHSRAFAEALNQQGSSVIYRETRDGRHQDEIAIPYQKEIADFLTRSANDPVVETFNGISDPPLVRVAGWPKPSPEITLGMTACSDVGLDSRGFIYVARRCEQPLLRLKPDGSLDRVIGESVLKTSVFTDYDHGTPRPLGEKYWLHGLCVDAGDNVWVTDVGRHLVFKFSPDGELLMTLGVDGVSGADGGHFNQPTHVAVSANGDIFVTDGYGNARVAKFSPEGKFITSWGIRGFQPGEFHTPHTLVFDRAGLLYVSDRDNDRVQVFDQDGHLQALWPDLHSVDALCFAPDGLLYGAAGLDKALIRLTRDGRLMNVWRQPAGLPYAHGICVDRDGYIYAAASGKDLWKFAPAPPVASTDKSAETEPRMVRPAPDQSL